MKREKRESLKNQLIADIEKRIAQGSKIDEIIVFAEKKCQEYFPFCDETFVKEMGRFAYWLQNLYHARDIANLMISKYKEGGK